MDVNALYTLLTFPIVITFFLSFIGAILGEAHRDLEDGQIQSPIKFIVELLSSAVIGTAIATIISIVFKIDNASLMGCATIVFGFIGHKNALTYLPNIKKK